MKAHLFWLTACIYLLVKTLAKLWATKILLPFLDQATGHDPHDKSIERMVFTKPWTITESQYLAKYVSSPIQYNQHRFTWMDSEEFGEARR